MSRDVREVVRDEPLMRSRLLGCCTTGRSPCPSSPRPAGLPEDEVMVWMMGLRKYGYVAEVPGANGDGYFAYGAVERQMSTIVQRDLADELRLIGSYDAEACMNCGVCTAVCPLEIDLLPRRLFRYVELGLADRVREESETVFSCLLCRACEESCPAERAHHRERSACCGTGCWRTSADAACRPAT